MTVGCSSSSTPAKDAGNNDTATNNDTSPTTDTPADNTTPDKPTDTPASTDGGGDADSGTLTTAQARGQYLTGLLGCVNCHSPKLASGAIDTTKMFSGNDCIPDASGNCLSTPNLTPDATGIMKFTDQQIIDAFRQGKDPESGADGGAPTYLFQNMPYYQFANLTDADAQAIIAYLRSVPGIAHTVKDNTGMYATQPAAPQWTPADPTKLPAPGTGAPPAAANGKYLATVMCATCHTVNVSADGGAAMPTHIDETKAFQGGKVSSITLDGGVMMFQSANLTPDKTGVMGWTATDLVTAIKMAKDKMGKTLCAPMRANAVITGDDATAIADYLLSLPAAANTINACMVRM
jgi:hypothetical protein